MLAPRALILRAPGTNCDYETAHAFERAGAIARRVHVRALAEKPSLTDDFQILCIPGGFSYGDDIASGRIFALELKLRLGDTLLKFRDKGGLMLGICNGFQVLLQTGLLLDGQASRSFVVRNEAINCGRFQRQGERNIFFGNRGRHVDGPPPGAASVPGVRQWVERVSGVSLSGVGVQAE